MNDIANNPKKQAVIYFFAVLIISFILWPLLDMFWCAVFTHSDFSYKPQDYIIEPFFFALLMTFVLYLPLVKRAKKKESEKTLADKLKSQKTKKK